MTQFLTTQAVQPQVISAQLRTPHAVLWDMDGTLIDSEPYWQQAETDLVQAGGGRWTLEDALALVGGDLHHAASVLQQAGARGTVEEIVNYLVTTVSTRIRANVPWREHALETLTSLADNGVPCALVTMSHGPIAQAFLDSVPDHVFSAVVTGDSVTHGKPHPEPYLTAATLLDVDITHCIAVEDSHTGITAARSSGARTICIESVLPLHDFSDLSRITTLRQLTPAALDVIMHGGRIDYY
ncbi:HAD family hydrolase [Timonella sp. A28]|uniref:HAD family hydrolase n=1 Tax=Timonella sp. A28 TaxID=3442640 RepID=UPI003EB89F22